MIESAGTTGDERDEAPARNFAWRSASIGLAVVEADDAELLHGWRSDPANAYEFCTWPRSLAWLRERIERDSEDADCDAFLVLLPDGTPIGQTALSRQNMLDGTAEVELMLDPRHRGQGHGTDALDALVDLAFGELPLYRLTAETHTGNARALAVLAKSGFVQEGVSRGACLHRGRRHDLAVFSLLRPEWEALNRPRAWDA
ncbi:GNAT family protein [Streptomyces sp. NPDC026665]|uniref:GNAT family N-acetyltransferase n=1 Tax=Streptomyces sp. NPDC026665 TaxID=3154798 RepID=UPI0033EF57B9